MDVLNGLSMLIVDDSAACRAVLRRVAEHLGMLVRCAETAMEAVQVAGLRRFDFVVLDIGLQDADGRALATAFRASPMTRSSVIICISGLGGENRQQASLLAGADMFMQKPFPSFARLSGQLIACHQRRKRGEEPRIEPSSDPSQPSSVGTTGYPEGNEVEIALFVSEDLKRAVARLEKGLKGRDSSTIHRAAHFLSGVAGLMGADELEQRCRILRRQDERDVDMDDVEALLNLTRAARDRFDERIDEPQPDQQV